MKQFIFSLIAIAFFSFPARGAVGDSYSITLIGGPTIQIPQTGLASGKVLSSRWVQIKRDFAEDVTAKPEAGNETEAGWLVALHLKLTQLDFKLRVQEKALEAKIYKSVDGHQRLLKSVSEADQQAVMSKVGKSQELGYAAHWMRVDILARLKALGVAKETIDNLAKYADDTQAAADK